jgi:ProP effector
MTQKIPRPAGWGPDRAGLDDCVTAESRPPVIQNGCQAQARPRLTLDPARSAAARERLGLAAAPAAPPASAPSSTPDEAHRRVPVRQLLVERYPATFNEPRPLKVGVKRDILAEIPSISRQGLRGFLKKHCGSVEYLKLLVEGASRFALNGDIAGAVTATEAEHAVGQLLRKISGGGG